MNDTAEYESWYEVTPYFGKDAKILDWILDHDLAAPLDLPPLHYFFMCTCNLGIC